MPARPSRLLGDRAIAIWLLLVGATALSWYLGTHSIGGADHRVVGIAVLAIAFVKARFVGLDFMELRDAPRLLRLAFEGWIAGVFLLLASLFLLN